MCYRIYVFMPGLNRYLPQSDLMSKINARVFVSSVRAAYPRMSVITLPY